MSPLFTDLRQSLRQFARRPSYPIVAVLSLSLAIAANGVVFGLSNGLILSPMTYPDPSSLVSVGGTFTTLSGDEGFIEQHSLAEVADIAEVPGLRDVATFDLGNRLISYGDVSDRVFTALIVSDPLPAMRTPLLYGRGFTADELAPGGPRVAIISHRLWANQFGGDPDMVGRTIRVNTDAVTLVGVISPATPLLGTDLWIPWGGDVTRMPRNRRQFTIIARLADDASEAGVNAGLATVAARTATVHQEAHPEYAGWRLRVASWSEAVTGNLQAGLWLLLGTGLAVLVVACVNLGSLLLARLNDRAPFVAPSARADGRSHVCWPLKHCLCGWSPRLPESRWLPPRCAPCRRCCRLRRWPRDSPSNSTHSLRSTAPEQDCWARCWSPSMRHEVPAMVLRRRV
jgi:putative ABC transport system permease protein